MLQDRVNVLDYILCRETKSANLGTKDWISACDTCKNRTRCDRYGVTALAVKFCLQAQPALTSDFLNRLAGSSPLMSQFEIDGLLFGKTSPTSKAADLRAILPMPAVMQIIDAALAATVNRFVDQVLPPRLGCWVGARPGTQCLEIAHSLQMVIEKGMDMKSCAAIAQQDVQTFYDTLRMLRIAKWLQNRGLNPGLTACLLRHQLLTQVVLRSGALAIPITNRSVGGLTGSRLAGALGRVPIEDVIELRHDHWKKWGFKIDDNVSLTLSNYVDNMFSCSSSAENAVRILDDAAALLQPRWGLNIKPCSRKVMVCRYSMDTTPDSVKWPLVTSFPCLGHIIQHDGGIRQCYTETKRMMWRSFWGNSGNAAIRRSSVQLKSFLLNRCCKAIFAYRCSRWPPQPTIAKEVDTLQTRMMASILRTARLPGELAPDYCKRRNKLAATECRQLGRWSVHWFRRALAWDEHLVRGHSRQSWSVLLNKFHDHIWLEEQRLVSSMQGTGTRIGRGRPSMRWQDGVLHARRVTSP